MAEQKLAEADRDDRHRKRLICAAEGWLALASQLRRLEASPMSNIEIIAKRNPKKRVKVEAATISKLPALG
jgi:hypothetical protein